MLLRGYVAALHKKEDAHMCNQCEFTWTDYENGPTDTDNSLTKASKGTSALDDGARRVALLHRPNAAATHSDIDIAAVGAA